MKKIICVFLSLLICIMPLCSCGCEHEWADADCKAPKTCTKCGETEGEKLDHKWIDATCKAPKTCEVCAKTKGDALPHKFKEASCAFPKTCTECKITEGDPLGHTWIDASYSFPKTCSVCNATQGKPIPREDLGLDCDTMANHINQIAQLLGYSLLYLGNDQEGWPVYDVILNSSEASANVNITFEPINGARVYSIAIYSEDPNDIQASVAIGALAGVTLVGIDENFDSAKLSETLQGEPTMQGGVAYHYMESCGLAAELQTYEDGMIFWIYPA